MFSAGTWPSTLPAKPASNAPTIFVSDFYTGVTAVSTGGIIVTATPPRTAASGHHRGIRWILGTPRWHRLHPCQDCYRIRHRLSGHCRRTPLCLAWFDPKRQRKQHLQGRHRRGCRWSFPYRQAERSFAESNLNRHPKLGQHLLPPGGQRRIRHPFELRQYIWIIELGTSNERVISCCLLGSDPFVEIQN